MNDERRYAFKVGFLRKLAELSITPDEFYKRAVDVKGFGLGDVMPLATGLGSGLAGAGVLGGKALGIGAAGLPLALGGAAGVADAALNAPTDDDIEDLRRAELIGLLRRMTGEVKQRSQRVLV